MSCISAMVRGKGLSERKLGGSTEIMVYNIAVLIQQHLLRKSSDSFWKSVIDMSFEKCMVTGCPCVELLCLRMILTADVA